MKTAVVVIDIQNDYFPGGQYPLWNTDTVLGNTLELIKKSKERGDLVVLVQHVANPAKGISPFFNEGTTGVEIHRDVMAAAPEAPIVVKQFADSFEQTNLEEILVKYGVEKLRICGMMTQNCVTHTAISRAADTYDVTVIGDCSTTVDEMIHNIALSGISTRVQLSTLEEVSKS